ncbi:hypothetical protein [Pseudonocardia nigra]|uniref:hypothetical protein n=1 Tax=Pseudonocardia nigra TaxID=1921578 RepID=UPI001C6063B6|nr:hypothetical protein [Pseudonocardia nigra]
MTDRRWLAAWAGAVGADPENAHIGRFSRCAVRLLDDTDGDVVRYQWRRSPSTSAVPPMPALSCAVRAAPGANWSTPRAAPRRHHLLSLTKAADGIEIVAGRDHLIRHLRVITRLVELGRGHS